MTENGDKKDGNDIGGEIIPPNLNDEILRRVNLGEDNCRPRIFVMPEGLMKLDERGFFQPCKTGEIPIDSIMPDIVKACVGSSAKSVINKVQGDPFNIDDFGNLLEDLIVSVQRSDENTERDKMLIIPILERLLDYWFE